MAYTIKARLKAPPEARVDGGGIDHNQLFVAFGEDNQDVAHQPCVIPNSAYGQLLEPMSQSARVALYKNLIIEYYGAPVDPLRPPTPPSGLSDIESWNTYLDERDTYNAELSQRTTDAETWVEQATTWIEGFHDWADGPLDFTLQVGD